MASMKKKIGRPTIDSEGPLGSKIGFRPSRKAREYLDRQVETGKANNLNSAIQVAVERGMMLEKERLYKSLGGKHTVSLVWLLARIAVTVEFWRNQQRAEISGKLTEKTKWKKWTDDPEALFLMMMLFGSIVRQFFPRDWFAQDIDMLGPLGSRGGQIWDIYSQELRNLESALDNPNSGFWPLSHAEPILPGYPGYSVSENQSLLQINELVEVLSSLRKRTNRADELDGDLGRLTAAQEASNLAEFVDQSGFEPLFAAQKEIADSGRTWDELSHKDLVELVAKHGGQLPSAKTSDSSAKSTRSSKQK